MILHIYADYDKRIGAYKITYILGRDYGIFTSVGRVYRLMHSMQLPPISTIKPKSISRPKELSGCYANHLHQAFHQKAPNLVWTSDFTYLKAGGKWYYLCIIMDLFLEKLSLAFQVFWVDIHCFSPAFYTISQHCSVSPNTASSISAMDKSLPKTVMPFS